MTGFWIKFLQTFDSFPSIRSLVLAILMMARSRREVSRLCELIHVAVHLTTEDKKGMEDAWEGFFKRHRPGASWVAGESIEAVLLLVTITNVQNEERTAYYFTRAMRQFRSVKTVYDEEGSASLILNSPGRIFEPPVLYFNGYNILPCGKLVSRDRTGKPMCLHTAFTFWIPVLHSPTEAERFLARLGRTNTADPQGLSEKQPVLTVNYNFVDEELDLLLPELEEVPVGTDGWNYQVKSPGFHTKLLELLAARGLVFDLEPPRRHSTATEIGAPDPVTE